MNWSCGSTCPNNKWEGGGIWKDGRRFLQTSRKLIGKGEPIGEDAKSYTASILILAENMVTLGATKDFLEGNSMSKTQWLYFLKPINLLKLQKVCYVLVCPYIYRFLCWEKATLNYYYVIQKEEVHKRHHVAPHELHSSIDYLPRIRVPLIQGSSSLNASSDIEDTYEFWSCKY